jgi:hypothetical protein
MPPMVPMLHRPEGTKSLSRPAERVSAQKHLGGLLTRALTNWMEGSQTRLAPSGTEFKSQKDAIHTSVPQHSSINSQDIGRNVTAEDFLNADVAMAARMVKLSPLSEECASCPATQTNLGSICGSQTSKPIAQRLPLVQDQNRYISSLRNSTENGLNNLMILCSGASDHCRWSNLKAQSSTVRSDQTLLTTRRLPGRWWSFPRWVCRQTLYGWDSWQRNELDVLSAAVRELKEHSRNKAPGERFQEP